MSESPGDASARYRESGVDIDAGNALVERIKPLAAATRRAGSDASLGGFGAIFDLAACNYRDPLLVASTDGVGTKLMIARAVGQHDTIGIDLVAMCVNDLVVQGAEPLFFLDYFATGKLDVAEAGAIVAGIAEGCRQAGCALVGGETAEMPGLYRVGDYDLAGFAVGAVERDRLLTGATVRPGDVVLGVDSHGLHANGFSLVRKVVSDHGLGYDLPAPYAPAHSLGRSLLTPTRIYVKAALRARDAGAKAFAHITGGGLVENLPRVLPEAVAADIDVSRWPLPPVFAWLAAAGRIAPEELARTFNCGIGLIAVAAPGDVGAVTAPFLAAGDSVTVIGAIRARASAEPAIRLDRLDSWRV